MSPLKLLKNLSPVWIALIIYFLPPPEGLTPNAMHYVAVFVGVVVALIIEPIPAALSGMVGVTIIAILQITVSPESKNPTGDAISWALKGFTNTTVWLIFLAFMFARGYEKTLLGKRIALLLIKYLGKRALGLGYAVSIADLILAPFIPSNSARSAGTIYPIVRSIPEMYGSLPNKDPRKIGSYLMWTSLAATCVTSSMFYTALAPNLLALPMISKQTGVTIEWGTWFLAMLPVSLILFLATPILSYYIYPPTQKIFEGTTEWASNELKKQGSMSRKEIGMALFALLALVLWIFGGKWIDGTLAAMAVLSMMIVFGVIDWDDFLGNKAAWNTCVWFATLVTLAGGLKDVGFLAWFGEETKALFTDMSITTILVTMVVVFFVSHYLFASVTAHVTALLPIFITLAMSIPGINLPAFAMLMCGSLGIMGIITPYGTGPSPVYFGSGYLPSNDFWRLGAIFGFINLAVFLLVGMPYILWYFS